MSSSRVSSPHIRSMAYMWVPLPPTANRSSRGKIRKASTSATVVERERSSRRETSLTLRSSSLRHFAGSAQQTVKSVSRASTLSSSTSSSPASSRTQPLDATSSLSKNNSQVHVEMLLSMSLKRPDEHALRRLPKHACRRRSKRPPEHLSRPRSLHPRDHHIAH